MPSLHSSDEESLTDIANATLEEMDPIDYDTLTFLILKKEFSFQLMLNRELECIPTTINTFTLSHKQGR